MDTFGAVMTLEEMEERDPETEVRALQALVNGGHWGMQGRIGRQMMDAIEAGLVALGPEPAFDYWGNRIPSRHEVRQSSVGSTDYVERHSPFGAVLEGEVSA